MTLPQPGLIFTVPAFRAPSNKISARDLEGWVEQRGSKFLKTWDINYEALLSTADAGQEPQNGGLLVANYGKGVYVYNAYALYRQLPEGFQERTGSWQIC
jgi:hypothetical protein